MKNQNISMFAMAVCSFAITHFACAETEKVGDYTWQYSVVDGKAWIGSGVAETAAIFPKPVGEVTVPSELGGYEVWRLDSYALYGCDELTRLVIPDCVHQMGGSAVRGCSTLREVSLPENLEFVAGNLFRDCTSLREITIPASVEKIDSNAFESCSSVTNIILNDGIKKISQGATPRHCTLRSHESHPATSACRTLRLKNPAFAP